MKLTIIAPLAGLAALALAPAALGGAQFAGQPLGPGFPEVIDIFPFDHMPVTNGTGPETMASHTILPGPVILGTVVLLDTTFVPPDPFNHALWSDVVNFLQNAQGQYEAEMWSDTDGLPLDPPNVNLGNLFYVLESRTDPFTIYAVPGLQYHIFSDPVPSPASGGALLACLGAAALRRRR
jgi:MYXO-CTERM domain-containing protein